MNDVQDKNNARYLKYRSKFFISEFLGTGSVIDGRSVDGNFHVWIRQPYGTAYSEL